MGGVLEDEGLLPQTVVNEAQRKVLLAPDPQTPFLGSEAEWISQGLGRSGERGGRRWYLGKIRWREGLVDQRLFFHRRGFSDDLRAGEGGVRGA